MPMRVALAAVLPRRQGLRAGPVRELFWKYVERIGQYAETEVIFLETEAALLERVRNQGNRVAPHLVLLDGRGKLLSSEEFAVRLGQVRDLGTQQVVFAIGPAGGWSDAARSKAQWLFSLGLITLPHELALVVLAEQLYRAHTILAGHPYHLGH